MTILASKGFAGVKAWSEEDIITQVLLSKTGKGFVTRPPTSFVYEGKTYTAQNFLRDYIGVDQSALNSQALFRVDGLPAVLQSIRANLAGGLPTSFGVPLEFDRMRDGHIYGGCRRRHTSRENARDTV